MNAADPRRRQLATLERLNLHGARGLLLAAALGLLALPLTFGDGALLAMRYERTAIAHGELWRLLSAHLVHLGPRHALGDMAALALLWALFAGELAPRAWALVLGASVAAIDAGLWWLSPQVLWYAGISGVLHGAWAAGAGAGAARREPVALVLFATLALKLGWELVRGASPLSPDLPVVVEAHAYGALGGLLAWRLAALRRARAERL